MTHGWNPMTHHWVPVNPDVEDYFFCPGDPYWQRRWTPGEHEPPPYGLGYAN